MDIQNDALENTSSLLIQLLQKIWSNQRERMGDLMHVFAFKVIRTTT